jgi:hypothetical protein
VQIKQLLASLPPTHLNHYHVSTALWRLAHLVNACDNPKAARTPASDSTHAGLSRKDMQVLPSVLKLLEQQSLGLMSQAVSEVSRSLAQGLLKGCTRPLPYV